MNNADMPAMPLTDDQVDRLQKFEGYEGLTKREAFAMSAMQGLASREGTPDPKGDAYHAVQYADALLFELEGYWRS